MGHKADGRCAQFFAPSNFTRSAALVRSIEAACAMTPYLSTLETPQSKLRTSLRSLFSDQEIDVATQHNICAANQERENQTMAPQSPTFRRDSFKTSPASIAMDRSRICSPRSASPSASRGFQCLIPGINLPHALSNHEVFAHKNAQNEVQDDGYPEGTGNSLICSWLLFGGN
jgi:hypothetical protein